MVALFNLLFVKLPVLLFTHPIRVVIGIVTLFLLLKWFTNQGNGKQK